MYGTKRLKVASVESFETFDWEKCCLCQLKTKEKLVQPFLNKDVSQRMKSYQTMARNIEEFNNLGKLPQTVFFSSLNEGDAGIVDNLIRREATWHKSCSLRFASSKLELAKKKHVATPPLTTDVDEASSTRLTRSLLPSVDTFSNNCCLCRKGALWNEPLHQVLTSNVAEQLRNNAPPDVLAAIGLNDCISQEVKYHRNCLNNMLNPNRSCPEMNDSPNYAELNANKLCENMAFSYLVDYIQSKINHDEDFIFKMSDLTKFYETRLQQLLGHEQPKLEVHSSRLREKIETHFPTLIATKVGNGYQLMPDKTNLLKYAENEDADEDAVACMRFLKRMRHKISESSCSFSGTFTPDCQQKSVPPALLAFVEELLYGSTSLGEEEGSPQPAVTISQLIILNYRSRPSKKTNICKLRNKRNFEPPLPLYLALNIYGRSRDKALIDEMHHLGITVSSNRVMQVTSALSQLVVMRAQEEGEVCPSKLRRNLFTVGAYDNIDHNPSSTTSNSSFHGTSISVFQMTTPDNPGEERIFMTSLADTNQSLRTVPELPGSFAKVETTVLPSSQPEVPQLSTAFDFLGENKICFHDEDAWLEHCKELFSDEVTSNVNYSWASFHASQQDPENICVGINSLLPLFSEDSMSVSMVAHGLDLLKNMTHILNPGQIPVMWMDQPLYKTAKLLQWNFPGTYGEEKFVIMFAPFHIEQAFLRLIGQFVDSSGWTDVVQNSGEF